MSEFKSPYSTSYYKVPSKAHEAVYTEPLARHTILTGAVRTGKTRLAFTRFVQEILRQYKLEPHIRKQYCIIARSRASLKYNIIDNLYDWFPHVIAKLFPTSQHSSGFTCLNNKASVRYFPIDDERSISRLMGATLQGVFFDEVAYCTHGIYAKVTSRLTGIKASMFQPFIISTCNPAGISHWLNASFILPSERGEADPLNIKSHKFQLNHETCGSFLPSYTIDALTNDYKNIPSLYKRYILGEWCSAGGAVFPMLDHTYIDNTLPLFCTEFVLGVDFGYIAPTAVVLVGILPHTYFGKARACIIANAQFTTSDISTSSAEYRADVIIDLIGNRNVHCIVYDSANPEQAQSLDNALRNKGVYLDFYLAEKNIKESVELLLLAISSRRLLFTDGSINTLHCFSELEYDEKERDKIVVTQNNDHLFDATRYACMHPSLQNILKRNER